jgi:hypothetical protein
MAAKPMTPINTRPGIQSMAARFRRRKRKLLRCGISMEMFFHVENKNSKKVSEVVFKNK